MADLAALRREAARLVGLFEAAGAGRVETDILQPADVLLDLYGEDIRARAFVTHDPARGEMMLRPDFTVPVLRAHLANGGGEARYCYGGKVFRAQEVPDARPPEYWQVGFEVIGAEAPPAEVEAEVFARIVEAVPGQGLRAAMGDIGLILAAIEGLETTERRKAALRRHVWRPRRFRALIERFAGRAPAPAGRKELLARADPMEIDAPLIGLRSREEIAERIEALREDAAQPPIDARQVDLLEQILALRLDAPAALKRLGEIARDMPAIAPALAALAARCEALRARGIDPSGLTFEGSYGRTSLEYYDGFVFGLYAEGRPELPPVATGGRYDALARQLGGGQEAPAVGAVIRPDLVLALGEGAP